MKILCIADHIDPRVYSCNIKTRFPDIDFVLSAGDLRLSYYDFITTNLNKPLFFVFGNHRLKGIEYYKKDYGVESYMRMHKKRQELAVGATYVDSKIVKEKGVLIAGLGGSIWYNGGKNQFTEFTMFLKMLHLLPRLLWNRIFHNRFLDILLTHSPPYGLHDKKDRCHRGFKVFRLFMKLFKPAYLVHGHVHLYSLEDKRKDAFCDTMVVNAYNYCIIEL
ncbi:MAG: metallophosphoesterase [Spirochaetales bacterium]|nr:metallophosphoesterase [Spirochaetales bacterium]